MRIRLPLLLLLVCALAAAAAAPASAAGAPRVFRVGHRAVTCAFGTSFPDNKPAVTCYSRVVFDIAPPEDLCGSGHSALELPVRGEVRLASNCNPYDVGGVPVRTLRRGDRIARGPLICQATGRRQLRCRSRVSGHGFELAPGHWDEW